MSGIVISYRRDDAEGSAGRLYDRLASRYGADFVFMDFNSIGPGEDWLKTIDTTVASSNVLLAVIGPRWSSAIDDAGRRRLDDDRDYVRREIRTAASSDVRLLPVLVQGARMVGSEALPADIATLAEVQPSALDSRYYDRDVAQLCRLIDGILGFGDEIPRWDLHRTAVAGFVGLAASGPKDEPTLVTSWRQFQGVYGGHEPALLLAHGVHGWFANGGGECYVVRVGDDEGLVAEEDFVGSAGSGLAGLEGVDAVTIVAAPDIVGLYGRGLYRREQVLALQYALLAHCELMFNRLAILDPLPGLDAEEVLEFIREVARWDSLAAAFYYPWVKVPDPVSGRPVSVPPSGHIAGTWARNDTERAVWAAPANLPLEGVLDLERSITSQESFVLQGARVNVIRGMPGQGIRAWGAGTLSSEPKFGEVATKRVISSLGTFIRGVTSWAAFEPSSARTWNRLQSGVEIVLESLWRQGAFAGEIPAEAFYARCDEEVNVPELVAVGRIRVEFGFALKSPGDFVRMTVEQPSGDLTLYLD
jgi:hypothetical protein